jgi:hypothetical protein
MGNFLIAVYLKKEIYDSELNKKKAAKSVKVIPLTKS